jgi:hypothetical protein
MARKAAPKYRLTPHLPIAQLGWIGVKAALTLGLLAGLVGGLAWLGGRAGQSVANRPRYTIPFADLKCDAPPGLDRATFLGEVRYLANLPDTVQSVDPALPATLSAAFAMHPWVAAVTGVTAGPDGAVTVGLTFRQPVLVVSVHGEGPRLVDATGVLLPVAPTPTGVTVLVGEVLPPTVPAGAVWPDPIVKRAAEWSTIYKPAPASIQRQASGWRLVLPDGRALAVSY